VDPLPRFLWLKRDGNKTTEGAERTLKGAADYLADSGQLRDNEAMGAVRY
jgi:hypothetical protein